MAQQASSQFYSDNKSVSEYQFPDIVTDLARSWLTQEVEEAGRFQLELTTLILMTSQI